ncbi:MAG: acyltransferase [Novosphingobium sp.]
MKAPPRPARQTASGHRFHALDGLRGIAALAVVFVHSFGKEGGLPNAGLAVDFFFLMSGFVIAHSYSGRLAAGMSPRSFYMFRFVRLYPMIFAGAILGIGLGCVHNLTNPADAYPWPEIVASGSLSLLALPYLVPALNIYIFSFNPPMWSLFFEAVANFIFGLIDRRTGTAVLFAIVAVSLAWTVMAGPPGGSVKADFYQGFPRVLAGFFGGVAVFRVWTEYPAPWLRGGLATCAVPVIAVMALPYSVDGLGFLAAFLVLLVTLWAAVNARPGPLDGFSARLGEASYPIYLLHYISLYVVTFVVRKLGLSDHMNVALALHLAVMPVLGLLAYRWYEKPAIRSLKAAMTARPRVLAAASA